MAKTYSHNYSPEKLAQQSRENVETIRKNAIRLGAIDLVEMCDRDLESRSPRKVKRVGEAHPRLSNTDVIVGYHFVCVRDRGVTLIGDGRFRSGSWVVAEQNIKNSLRYGAYLALHESKSEPSYRQGQILNYQRTPRDMLPSGADGEDTRVEQGIEFLVRGTDQPYAWVGAGTGEKGYEWAKISGLPGPRSDNATSPQGAGEGSTP
jgi:hypothetical protein